MNENLKTIEDLLSLRFKIDAYQRGYRWDTAQVYSLLSDINEFEPEFQSFYCLQPLVVKKLDDNIFELVDGQQRATTIFLILTYFNHRTFQLLYTTRGTEESGINSFFEMLSSLETTPTLISSISDDFSEFDNAVSLFWKEKITKHNPAINTVDNFYFYRTYSVVKSWFSQLDDITKEQFKNKLITQTKVIWYLENEDSTEKNIINKFIDFNQGKIELEQAELIKALFVLDLKSISNVVQQQYEENQFADEWNLIEHQMSEEKFWQFISNSKYNSNIANKINLLFQLYNGFGKTEDHFYNYRKFEKAFKNKDENKKPEWQKITGLYNGLEEWYFDRTSYHLVGAVIHLTNNNIFSILETAKKAENKTHFCNLLRDKIKSYFKEGTIWKKSFNPDSIKYGDDAVFKLLLLYNIALTEIEEVDTFFPFNRFYNTNDWNIEHILAKNADRLDSFEEFRNFHLDITDLVSKLKEDEINPENKHVILQLCNELDEFIRNNKKADCVKKINEINEKLIELLNVNDFSNLCFLDQSTNIKVGKKPFRRKRNIVLNLDNEIHINPNTYIPIGTQYVFSKKTTPSKYFQIDYWSQKDKEFYIEKVKSIIDQFLKIN
ncbi:MAG: DUF262 domain-containing protein [Paludibacter sp.]|nr:DUF262 domain-containing protein [Paludibacter sp.]